MEWNQRNKVQITLIKPRVYWIFVTKLMVDGVNFLVTKQKTEVVMRIAVAELLAFAYNVEYLLRLTKLKYTYIFIVYFHGSRIYSAYHHKGPQ